MTGQSVTQNKQTENKFDPDILEGLDFDQTQFSYPASRGAEKIVKKINPVVSFFSQGQGSYFKV